MITAIIVDDEVHSSEALQILLNENCKEVKVVACCTSGKEAIQKINLLIPQLIFLDVEMPHMNGFELLQKIQTVNLDIIFTTSYNHYAIKAFKFSAIDYLLKPVDREELIAAVNKVVFKHSDNIQNQLQLLLQKISQPSVQVEKIALPTMQGLEIIPINSIVYCSANNNYTEFILVEKRKILVSRTLKEMEELLSDFAFLRVHNSYLVNLNAINRYIRGEGGYLMMSDGSTVDVSRSRKELLMQKLQPSKF